jgi:hypothetical protein
VTRFRGNEWTAVVLLVEVVVVKQGKPVCEGATTRKSRASGAFCFVRPGVMYEGQVGQ